MDIVSK